ncbi:MAG: hypothetical protein EXX96DRAFT_606293 [Benjaminiella poitrasii]|nr:MAG: hypothetical protein EXX96DRAFT_606293 [Benjaminiella poitrasii]
MALKQDKILLLFPTENIVFIESYKKKNILLQNTYNDEVVLKQYKGFVWKAVACYKIVDIFKLFGWNRRHRFHYCDFLYQCQTSRRHLTKGTMQLDRFAIHFNFHILQTHVFALATNLFLVSYFGGSVLVYIDKGSQITRLTLHQHTILTCEEEELLDKKKQNSVVELITIQRMWDPSIPSKHRGQLSLVRYF